MIPPPPPPIDSQSSVIGMWLKMQAPWRIFHTKPSFVYFVKMDDQHGVLTQNHFIRSNYSHGNQVYLLNAEPGTYAAVAAVCERQLGISNEKHYYFSEELIKLTKVTVTPGTVAFMGAFTVDTSGLLGFISSGNLPLPSRLVVRDGFQYGLAYLARPCQSDHDEKAEEAFLSRMCKYLKDSAWVGRTEQQMRVLQARP